MISSASQSIFQSRGEQQTLIKDQFPNFYYADVNSNSNVQGLQEVGNLDPPTSILIFKCVIRPSELHRNTKL